MQCTNIDHIKSDISKYYCPILTFCMVCYFISMSVLTSVTVHHYICNVCNLNCVYLGILYFVCTHSGFPISSLVLFDFLCDVSIVYVAALPFYNAEKLVYSSTCDHLQFDVTV